MTARLTHTRDAFVRLMQMSRTEVFVFVEGDSDLFFWARLAERAYSAPPAPYRVTDLARKIRRYIRQYNKAAKPIRWSYRNPAHRISITSASTVH